MSELGGIEDRLTLIVAGAYFDDCRYDYDVNNNMLYMGLAVDHKTSVDQNDWYIWKFTHNYTGNLIRKEGPLKGSWANRSALDWG